MYIFAYVNEDGFTDVVLRGSMKIGFRIPDSMSLACDVNNESHSHDTESAAEAAVTG